MSLYKRPDSDIWWVNISIKNHPRLRRSTGTADRLEAQRIHDEIKAKLWAAPRLKGHTWGNAVLLWAEQPGRGTPDLLAIQKFSRSYKDRLLADVTVESLIAALSFCKTPGTYMRYRNRITAILNLAKAHGWVKEVPVLPTKRVPPSARMWLTREEWDRLYVHLPEHQRRMALFSVETGLRQRNVLDLRWGQLDLERKLVWYDAETMKGRKDFSAPLSDTAIKLLTAMRKGEPDKDAHVFTYRGKPIKSVKTAFKRVCIEQGFGHKVNNKYVGFTWHGLRHTWATWHVQNGTPLGVLQRLGGWSDLDMVMVYAKHSADFVAEYANNHRKKK